MGKNQRLYAIFWYILHLFISFANDAITKYLLSDLSIWQILFFRLLIGSIMLFGFIIYKKQLQIQKTNFFLHFVRGTLFFIAIWLWGLGLKYSVLSTCTLISFTVPIFVLILAPIFLNEKMRKEFWIASIISFMGIFIIINPQNIYLNLKTFYLLGAAIIFAFLDILNKKYVNEEGIINMILYSSFFASLYTLVPAYQNWLGITYHNLLPLILLAVGGIVILFFLLKAFSHIEASFLAPFRYIEIIISILGGWLFFGEVPSISLYISILFIVPSSLYVSLKK